MNPVFLIIGGVAFVVLLYAKGYLGLGDLFGLAATAKPGSIMSKPSSKDLFGKAVKVAMEEAHDEIAGKMADDFRSQVVAAHVAAFPGSGPSAQPAPESTPAAPPAS